MYATCLLSDLYPDQVLSYGKLIIYHISATAVSPHEPIHIPVSLSMSSDRNEVVLTEKINTEMVHLFTCLVL